jgi:FkbM family methyltransferase
VVSERLLREPFVLIDVGVQGGEDQRWQPLGDHLVVHGFDPIEEVVHELTERNHHRPNCHYHCMALGSVDGEREFYFNPANPTASSMFRRGTGRFDVENAEQPRQVPIRRLDCLLAEGLIPQADFIKVDVEGFEKEVLLGARELLSGGVLGLHTETNFGVSPHYPKSHFATLAELALDQHLLVFDIAFNRIPRATFQRALVDKGMKPIAEHYLVGRPATVDVLFCRDLIDEADQPDNYQTPCRPFVLDQLIKAIIIYELHGLNDVALDTVKRFAKALGERLDVDHAVQLLAIPDCRGHDILWNLRKRIEAYEQSTSWRITAPLRWAKHFVFRSLRESA